MTDKRRDQILASLRAGNTIRRVWSGANVGGYLAHRLEGVKNLRKTEVVELQREGLLEIVENRQALGFSSFRLKGSDK